MRVLTVILIGFLFSSAVFAEGKIAVVPIHYKMKWGGTENVEFATQLEQDVSRVIQEAGFAVVDPKSVRLIMDDLGLQKCPDPACVDKLSEELGAAEVVCIAVENNDNIELQVEVMFAQANDISALKPGSADLIHKWIVEKVARSLPQKVKVIELPELSKPVEPVQSPILPTFPAGEAKTTDRQKLSVVPFAVMAGVTGALGVGWGVMEVLTYRKVRGLEDDKWHSVAEWEREKTEARRFQIIDTAILGTALAGVVTTCVLAAFTDFKVKKTSKKGRSQVLVPVVADRGGFVYFYTGF
jgi:hypothetical protein